MPVYNAESTLGRMIESIVAQTYRHWELIAIDDGSTDSSGTMLDQYSRKDSRIKVTHKPNGGVASARQCGINQASGVFTIHADSDDWIEPAMLQDMVQIAVDEDSDIVISDYYVDRPGQKTVIKKQCPRSLKPLDVLYALYAKDLFGGLWHKLIRKSIYDKGHVEFISGINYCEDLLVLTQMLTRLTPRISYLPRAYYHYMLYGDSLTRTVSADGLLSIKKFHASALQLLPQESCLGDLSKKFALDEFLVYFMNRLYGGTDELRLKYLMVKDEAMQSKSIRWKLGYRCIELGLIKLAHKLLSY